MVEDPKAPAGFSLRRWSQLKHETARGERQDAPSGEPGATALPGNPPGGVTQTPPAATPSPLPPVETLTFESDFSAFMQPKVEEATRRAALKKLFGAPSFNVMDGLDIYVGDYTQADPMPAGMLEKLAGVYGILDAPEHAADGAAPVPGGAALPAPAAATEVHPAPPDHAGADVALPGTGGPGPFCVAPADAPAPAAQGAVAGAGSGERRDSKSA
jgi:hypothetical protein